MYAEVMAAAEGFVGSQIQHRYIQLSRSNKLLENSNKCHHIFYSIIEEPIFNTTINFLYMWMHKMVHPEQYTHTHTNTCIHTHTPISLSLKILFKFSIIFTNQYKIELDHITAKKIPQISGYHPVRNPCKTFFFLVHSLLPRLVTININFKCISSKQLEYK